MVHVVALALVVDGAEVEVCIVGGRISRVESSWCAWTSVDTIEEKRLVVIMLVHSARRASGE